MKTKILKVKITFLEPVLGTWPSNQNVARDFIASKSPDAATIEDEVAALGADAVADKGMTVFPRNENGEPVLYDYQIKGFFKDSCGMLARVGGSMLIATEKDGKRTDDEAYKKAYTDAQSVACKALGIGADVYWEKDPTKYDRPTAPSPAKPTCASCGKPVAGFTYKGEEVTAQQAADRSKKKYGRILCMECAKKQPKEDGGLTHA